jgi:hypothetical protein
LEAGRIYVRDGTESTIARHEQVQKLINRRLESGFSTSREMTVAEHLAELHVLYQKISPTIFVRAAWLDLHQGLAIGGREERNPNYPKESEEAFIARMIELKKTAIEELLVRERR